MSDTGADIYENTYSGGATGHVDVKFAPDGGGPVGGSGGGQRPWRSGPGGLPYYPEVVGQPVASADGRSAPTQHETLQTSQEVNLVGSHSAPLAMAS